jgi:hypothetical protein
MKAVFTITVFFMHHPVGGPTAGNCRKCCFDLDQCRALSDSRDCAYGHSGYYCKENMDGTIVRED